MSVCTLLAIRSTLERMSTWGYKATSSMLDHTGTMILAKRGVICRSAYEENGSKADKVSQVEVGDHIHLYYSGKKGVTGLGLHEVTEPSGHMNPGAFGDRVEGTALFRLRDTSLISTIDHRGALGADPTLGVFTCWVIRRVGKARPYKAGAFPGMHTLVLLDPPTT